MPIRRARARIGVLTLAAAIGLSACAAGSSAPQSVTEGTGIRVVSPPAAQELLAAEPAPVLIDVRTPGEFAEGHLAGAVLVDFNAPDFRDRIAEYPRDARYVIYCRSGNRSEGARRIMAELGFTDVTDIGGGILAWAQAGLPITS